MYTYSLNSELLDSVRTPWDVISESTVRVDYPDVLNPGRKIDAVSPGS